MKMVNLAEAKAQLAALVRRAEKGERIVLSRRNQPVVELSAIRKGRKTDRPDGLCAGELEIPDDFDDPLPEKFLRDFEGR